MFKKTPKVNNRAAKISAIITLAAGALIFIIANGGIPMPWIAQTLGVALVAYSIYVDTIRLKLRRKLMNVCFGFMMNKKTKSVT